MMKNKTQPQSRCYLVLLSMSLFFITTVNSSNAFAQKPDKRGILPELQIKAGQSEADNEAKTMSSEILITRAENKAIDALQNILKKKKGSSDEPDLWYRLAELYMRRSKSGRFFDLHQDQKTSKWSSFPIPNEKGTDSIRKAIEIYNKIEKQFKNYSDMDSVYFNNAFAHQQLRLLNVSESLYKKLIENHEKSSLMPDALLALSELLYDQQRFKDALVYFKKLENYPNSRVFPYGIYKMAWTYYNLKDSENGVQKLIQVMQLSPAKADDSRAYNLRKEALRDLVIFIGDTRDPRELYSFFSKITTEEELGSTILDLAKLYDGYSRYKDIPIFIDEFNRKHPSSPYIVKTNLILVNSYEILKQRENVLEKLKVAMELCRPTSKWRIAQTEDNVQESCAKKFREESLEISKKWWEIWLKNKTHKEFSSLTERALRFILEIDDSENPDVKTRYALAELLFQQDKFEESSQQYQKVMAQTQDPVIQHDSSYAALFSLEKHIEGLKGKKPSEQVEESRKKLVLNYIQKHSKGEHIIPVQFKWALILYNENNFDESEKVLTTLNNSKTPKDIRTKVEDLVLDIYNIRKNFTGLKIKAKELAQLTQDPERKKNFEKISEQAHYSETQELVQKDKLSAAKALIAFANEHTQSNMRKEAQWQAMSIYYSEGYLKQGSDIGLMFLQQNPADKRSTDALKEAINSKIELGELMTAAELLQKLIQLEPSQSENYTLRAAQFYWLEGQTKEARRIYTLFLKSAKTEALRRKYQDLILATFSEVEKRNSEDYKRFVQTLVQQNIEPYATQYQMDKCNQLLENGKNAEAFELARKIMSRDIDTQLKAPARLIQAKILEDEFIKQSVKTAQEERMALVISMKAEKMEKALTSYLGVLKMSPTPIVQVETLKGLDRIYANYIDSLSNLRGPASINEKDMQALMVEINKGLDPIREKQKENKKELDHLMMKVADTLTDSSQLQRWSLLPASESPKPTVQFFNIDKQKPFIPEKWKISSGKWSELHVSKPACDKLDMEKPRFDIESYLGMTSRCALSTDTKNFLINVQNLLAHPQTRSWGYYYLSLAAEKQGLYEKALWAAEKSLQSLKDPQQGKDVVWYQKFRSQVRTQGWESTVTSFPQLLDLKISSTQIETLKSFQYFRSSQYDKVIEILSRLSSDELYTNNGVLIYSEALAQKGSVNEAVRVIKNSKHKGSVDGWLQIGRIYEAFKPISPNEATTAYEEALKRSTDPQQKLWIEKKMEHLKTLNKVSLL